jgi:hypothetical protein
LTKMHLTWLTRVLNVGDEVTITIVERAKVDSPTSRKSSAQVKAMAAKFQRRMEKKKVSNQSKEPAA